MGFRSNTIAKVWEIRPKSDKNVSLRVTISDKNKKTGEYEQTFSGYISCVGEKAAKKAAALKEGETITLGGVDVTNSYNKEKNITYTNFLVFDFEKYENKKKESAPVDSGEVEENEPDDGTPKLPF